MIKQLMLKNFVLFEEQNIDFLEGSNGLVGETGAGKSVVFSAINVLCGQRNLKRLIMKGAECYELEMTIVLKKISFSALNKINQILKQPVTVEDEVKIYRKLDLNSKSVIKINEQNYTLLELKLITEQLVDIHVQDTTNEILKEENHINIIDELIPEDTLQHYQEIYRIYEEQLKNLKVLNDIDQHKEEQLEILNFKLEQLQTIQNIEAEEVLLKQKNIIEQQQKSKQQNELIETNLNEVYKKLEIIKNNSEFIQIPNFEKKINNIYYEIEDLTFEHAKSINDFEDLKIEEVLKSLDLLKKLQRKYNLDYEGLLNKYEELLQEKDKIENISFAIIKAEKAVKETEIKLNKSAKALQTKRYNTAVSLVDKVNQNFLKLQMPNAEIKVQITECVPNAKGIDQIQILIKTNKGHEFETIDQIASGGEKSRIMLILKIVFNEYIPKLVYLLDEIDQGISSIVAKKVGEKLQKFAKENQLIIISHSVQVINQLDNLIQVSKYDTDKMTKSHVKNLQNSERDAFINKYLEI